MTGILGALAIILAFIGFGSLPLNLAGLMLIVLGVVLFVLEATVDQPRPARDRRDHLLRAGRVRAVHRRRATRPSRSPAVALPLIVTSTATTAILMGLITLAAIRTRHMAPPSGTVGNPVPLGTEGVVQAPLEPLGTAYLAGEAWSARTPDTRTLARDTPVRLVGFDGLTAIVEPTEEAAATGTPAPSTQ